METFKLKMDYSSKGLNHARKEAGKSTFSRARVGAVIVRGGRLLSSGCNQIRYSKYAARNEYESIHAEEAAIIRLMRKPNGLQLLAGATIFITRIKKDGSTGLAKPCKQCQALINAVGIKKVIHT